MRLAWASLSITQGPAIRNRGARPYVNVPGFKIVHCTVCETRLAKAPDAATTGSAALFDRRR